VRRREKGLTRTNPQDAATILDDMEKMRIFVSWSCTRGAVVAEALKEYQPMINNAFAPLAFLTGPVLFAGRKTSLTPVRRAA